MGNTEDHTGIAKSTELSLGPTLSRKADGASVSGFDTNASRKRKRAWHGAIAQASVELQQLNDPLPLDWEQFLDLQSGKMYYMDRRSLKRSWMRPKQQKLDLELSISSLSGSEISAAPISTTMTTALHNSSGNMVAAACLNCHLLVMLCKSFPSCPNCKYVHPPAPTASTFTRQPSHFKPLGF